MCPSMWSELEVNPRQPTAEKQTCMGSACLRAGESELRAEQWDRVKRGETEVRDEKRM